MTERVFLLLVLLFCTITAGAQTERRIYTKAELEKTEKREKEKREKEKRKKEKRIEEIQDSIRAVEAFAALEQLDFVVEADRLFFKRGESAFVASNTNFISLSDDKAVIQVAPFNGGGPNGVGGITLEGRASNIKLKTDKKGNAILNMSVSGTALSATIDVSLPKNSYQGTVTVSPNFHSNRVTLYGILLPSTLSDVYKGSAP